MHICLFYVCSFLSPHCIPVLVFPPDSGLDMIGLKDYEQLECMPLLKNDVNAYHPVFLEIVTFESNYEGMCVSFCFLCAKRQKKRQYEC